jgi:hypothetical protein
MSAIKTALPRINAATAIDVDRHRLEMGPLGHQNTYKGDDMQRDKEKDCRWQDSEKFFLQFLKYLVHERPLLR